MKREEYKQRLNELLEEDETLTHGSPDEILYMIDNMVIFGGYELGNRSVDHNILEFDDVSWEEILDWGILAVPETKTYISDTMVPFFEEELDYKRLPKNENHILGGN
ncbi:hypothetical protein L3K57_15595 (plasmid) [Enterococcus faecium]|uniref:hypothetical protein n=1 Tax=Enterococcus faecium TaxID=1352 RepID=UPI001F1D8A51|nr:hypothetical protein [Enterococcus faecium]UJV65228.1 hypothetical protein L3K57_15595 [Enterococcus faecium]